VKTEREAFAIYQTKGCIFLQSCLAFVMFSKAVDMSCQSKL